MATDTDPTDRTSSCLMCRDLRLETEDPRWSVMSDEYWGAFVQPEIAVPGWIILATKRHIESGALMNEDEARTFGMHIARLTDLLQVEAGAERVYLGLSGEDTPHFHILLAGRSAEVPKEERGMARITRGKALRDEVRAAETVARIKTAYGTPT